MNSRTAINLVLFVVVALLGAVAWWQPGVEKPKQATTLTELKAVDVTRVRIERADAENVAFEKRDGGWWMTEPVKAPANDLRLDGVLRIAGTRSQRQYPLGEVDLPKVGLEVPEVRLFLDSAPPIAFGDVEPLSQMRYVRVNDTVHLVEDTGYYHVIGAYTTFLANALLPEGAVIEGLSIPGLKLTRVEDRWQLQPRPANFSADQVNALLDEWRHAQSLDIRRYGGGTRRGDVVVQIKGREPIRFQLLARDEELILARTDLGVEYHLPGESAGRLLTLPSLEAVAPKP